MFVIVVVALGGGDGVRVWPDSGCVFAIGSALSRPPMRPRWRHSTAAGHAAVARRGGQRLDAGVVVDRARVRTR